MTRRSFVVSYVFRCTVRGTPAAKPPYLDLLRDAVTVADRVEGVVVGAIRSVRNSTYIQMFEEVS